MTPDQSERLLEYSYASPGTKSEDISGENADVTFREIEELRQRWDNRISVENLAFAKRYLKAEMEFGLVLDAGANLTSMGQQYVAVFKRKLTVPNLPNMPRSFQGKHDGVDQIVSDAKVAMGGSNGNENQVFVGDIDFVQTPEGIIPSFVRLQTFDEFYRGCTRAIDGTGFKIGLARTYWERSVLSGPPSILQDQGISEKVESRAEIVHTIPNNGAPLDRNGLAFTKAVHFVTGLRIYIYDEGVRLAALDEPARLTHLDHRNHRAVLLQGSKGSAQVVEL